MTVHIQRSVEKELPQNAGIYLTNRGSLKYHSGSKEFTDIDSSITIRATWWLQPIEIPDGEVTEEMFKERIDSICEIEYNSGGSKIAAKKLFALHLADKAGAVDLLQKEIDRLKEYEWMYNDLKK